MSDFAHMMGMWLHLCTNTAHTFPAKHAPKLLLLFSKVEFWFIGWEAGSSTIKLWFKVEHKRSINFFSEVCDKIGITTFYSGFVVFRTGRGFTVWLNCGSELSTNEAQAFPVKFVPKLVLLPSTVDMYFSGWGGRSCMVAFWFTVEHKRSANFSSEVCAEIGSTTYYSEFLVHSTGRGIVV